MVLKVLRVQRVIAKEMMVKMVIILVMVTKVVKEKEIMKAM
jgi:hypothetical protein